jgi:hypothetical protein
MPQKFTCAHCGKSFPGNPRVKKQKYCSALSCQNARKRKSDRKSTGTSKGKLLHQKRNKRWRDTYSAHEYQREYRIDHPQYVERNRELQRKRNKKRKKDLTSMIVKTDALLLQPLRNGAYMGFKIKKEKIVKTDAFILQMQVQQGIEAHLPQKPG